MPLKIKISNKTIQKVFKRSQNFPYFVHHECCFIKNDLECVPEHATQTGT
jgi:hypothetical protein